MNLLLAHGMAVQVASDGFSWSDILLCAFLVVVMLVLAVIVGFAIFLSSPACYKSDCELDHKPSVPLIAFVLLSLVVACPVRAAIPYNAVASIQSANGDGGSATLIGKNDAVGLMVTCAHIYDDGPGAPVVLFPSTGFRAQSRVLSVDRSHDISLLLIKSPPGIEPAVVSKARREDGPFTFAGFPYYSREHVCAVSGDYIGYGTESCEGWNADTVQVRCISVSGMSGGAIFNQAGELCGVGDGTTAPAAGMQEDRSYGPSGDFFVKFCGQRGDKIPVTYSQCCGGGCSSGMCGSCSSGQCGSGWQPVNQPHQVVIQQPRPVQQPQQPQITQEQVNAIVREAIDLYVSEHPPKQGEPGPPGQPGEPGLPGKPGSIAQIDYSQKFNFDYEQLAKFVDMSKVTINAPPQKPTTVNYLDGDGKVARTETIQPGEPINIPPQRVEWEQLGGKKITQARPLGDTLKFKTEKLPNQ